ncbi:MAG: 3-methyl-2-oxobutanoate hydroxymethyltransferase [Candidatus Peregrinibacteria bacterium]
MIPSLVWSTAYDIFSAELCEKSGMDAILVGDSLGMTVYGLKSTREVSKELMFPHIKAVCKTVKNTPVIVDFPFRSYDNPLIAVDTAEYFANSGATHFKLEGAEDFVLSAITELRTRDFLVTGHLGLTPQTALQWEVQGKKEKSAEKILSDAKLLEARGISFLVLECVPESLGKAVQESLQIPVIGIGAGRYVQGQVLVFDDLIGKTDPSFQPKFLRRFGNARDEALHALEKYKNAVINGEFPGEGEVY